MPNEPLQKDPHTGDDPEARALAYGPMTAHWLGFLQNLRERAPIIAALRSAKARPRTITRQRALEARLIQLP
jgi:topoisomerase IA-like protein